ncbi:class I SAM-dependent methyltransferase [Lewinella sp. IMCC34191]|uniref:class I SAM-dependent methyltransferase n=1 Tax=Lewinella sp. IMCC34191 TaxID=2259172 RepID=UPI000E282AE5|nr:class I SAM-dependent methyltransferase [Lewinella sp. IMCC34191]
MYDEFKANCYAAYRPELHDVPLELHLGDRRFRDGLDVGCGTGHSARALRAYCRRVTAIDSSQTMLRHANPTAGITYMHCGKKGWPVPRSCIDLITLGGSLFYLDKEDVVKEINRVGRDGTRILVYDFIFDPLPYLRALGVEKHEVPPNEYRVDCHLPTTAASKLRHEASKHTEVLLGIEPVDFAYLLLSEDWCRIALERRYGPERTNEAIVGSLRQRIAPNRRLLVPFDVTSILYRLRNPTP